MHQAVLVKPFNHQVQVQLIQTRFRKHLPPVVELDEETNATVDCDQRHHKYHWAPMPEVILHIQ